MRARASVKFARERSVRTASLIIVSPAPQRSTLGNSVTAVRYARIFRSLGWNVQVRSTYEHEPADCLVGLHAVKSAASAIAFRERNPDKRIVLVLTGTDLYRDIRRSAAARRAMDAADVLVTLQPAGIAEIPEALRPKAVAIIQSAVPVERAQRRTGAPFTVCVIGHLRYEKDPLRATFALRLLPSDLPIRVVQAGRILETRFEGAVARESQKNPRYRYLGSLSKPAARRLLAQSDLLVQSSRIEGGANAICEAIAAGVPVIASRISGNVGILGPNYPGLYPLGDTKALAGRLLEATTSPTYYSELVSACAALKALVSETRERNLWERVLGDHGNAGIGVKAFKTAPPSRAELRGG